MKALKIIGSLAVIGVGAIIIGSSYSGPSNWGPYSYSNNAGGLVFGIAVIAIGLALALKFVLEKKTPNK